VLSRWRAAGFEGFLAEIAATEPKAALGAAASPEAPR